MILRLGFVAAGLSFSALALWFNLNLSKPAADAAAAFDAGDTTKAITLYREALLRDNGNAYLWADLSDVLAASGDLKQARQCIDRAVSLAKSIPAIWVRHANFCFLHDDLDEALRSASRVLETVPDYDDVIFHYFDSIIDDNGKVLATIGAQPRTTRSWLNYLIRINKPAPAQLTWRHVLKSGYAEPPLAATYSEFLLRNRLYSEAQSAWVAFLGDRAGPYPARNLIFNGNFKSDPLPGPLDWKFRSQEDLFETTRSGAQVKIQFFGKENVNYDHFSQTVVLPSAGRYRLTMHVKTDGLTTNEGLRIAVADLGLASEPVTGTNDWSNVTLEFAVPQARSVRVGLVRRASQKFDNKIGGSATVDGVSLVPAGN